MIGVHERRTSVWLVISLAVVVGLMIGYAASILVPRAIEVELAIQEMHAEQAGALERTK